MALETSIALTIPTGRAFIHALARPGSSSNAFFIRSFTAIGVLTAVGATLLTLSCVGPDSSPTKHQTDDPVLRCLVGEHPWRVGGDPDEPSGGAGQHDCAPLAMLDHGGNGHTYRVPDAAEIHIDDVVPILVVLFESTDADACIGQNDLDGFDSAVPCANTSLSDPTSRASAWRAKMERPVASTSLTVCSDPLASTSVRKQSRSVRIYRT